MWDSIRRFLEKVGAFMVFSFKAFVAIGCGGFLVLMVYAMGRTALEDTKKPKRPATERVVYFRTHSEKFEDTPLKLYIEQRVTP